MRGMFLASIIGAVAITGCANNHTEIPSVQALHGANVGVAVLPDLSENDISIVARYPAIYPYFLTAASDRNIWFTEFNGTSVGRITQSGVVTQYPIPGGDSTGTGSDIARGNFGTVWFSASAIYKIDTASGSIRRFGVPSGCGGEGIVHGPDGNMWFTDECSSSIGRITPQGTVTEFAIPSGNFATQITSGPDGDLWFNEENAQPVAVGKITASGNITEYTGPVLRAEQPDSQMAFGPDGNLYAPAGSVLWQITPAGEFKSYAYPTSVGGAGFDFGDIIRGPDDWMWISGGGLVIKFNTTTHVFSKPLALNAPEGLAVGVDGDVWIADQENQTIDVADESVTTVGIRLNGEMSILDPNYGFELGYAKGTVPTTTQTIGLSSGESVQFENVDKIAHSAALLGDATASSAPWPPSFNGSTMQSPAGTAIGTPGFSTGKLTAHSVSPIYENGLPGFYMIGCQFHYNSNEMRTVIVVH